MAARICISVRTIRPSAASAQGGSCEAVMEAGCAWERRPHRCPRENLEDFRAEKAVPTRDDHALRLEHFRGTGRAPFVAGRREHGRHCWFGNTARSPCAMGWAEYGSSSHYSRWGRRRDPCEPRTQECVWMSAMGGEKSFLGDESCMAARSGGCAGGRREDAARRDLASWARDPRRRPAPLQAERASGAGGRVRRRCNAGPVLCS